MDKSKKFDKVLYIIIITALVLTMLVALLVLADSSAAKAAKEYSSLAVEAHSNPEAVIDFEMLAGENSDISAWLLAEGAGIDHPVVYSEKADYYRNHTFLGKRNDAGCLHFDTACSPPHSGRNTVIYGGEPLAPLYSYTSQEYYELLPSLTLYTPEGMRLINLIAGFYAEDIEETVKTEFSDNADFLDYVSLLRNRSEFVSSVHVDETDRLITLCAVDNGGAFVLVGIVESF